MDDSRIVDLYWARDERAISESDIKYGRMLTLLSFSLLSSREDAEECVNDTYLDAWGAMPTARPEFLGAFLSKITRRISIDRFRERHREKRGGIDNLSAELSDCIPSGEDPEAEYDSQQLREEINAFLRSLPKEKRVMFVLRYFYSRSVEEIALQMGLGTSNVKTSLFRCRQQLKKRLEEKELL
ncbi:MAG: sigma-70 family RNA polymerase sigma factor [Clostridia bacterium]|nr:sigma-70 family RNA polymerase sigma factor [Clostridia bacterium]